MASDLPAQSAWIKYGDGDRLSPLRQLLKAMGSPDQKMSMIHLAGTNGKGSTATMIATLLASHNKRVGLFTSPHLLSERESIQMNQQLISTADFQRYAKRVQTLAQEVLPKDSQLSQFEWVFLTAMSYFADQTCDYVVLECGVGGELDATNAITQSDYAIFTKIGLDHLNLLGDTLEEIVWTKSGIMRPNQTVIVAPNQKTAVLPLLKKRAESLGVTEICHTKAPMVSETSEGTYLLYLEDNQPPIPLQVGLRGHFQTENITTVFLWYQHWLKQEQLSFDPTHLHDALAAVHLPGRFERVVDHPSVILDAAHNVDAMTEVIETIQQQIKGQRLAIICGFLKDKDVKQMVADLCQLDAKFIVTTPDFPERAMMASDLAQVFAQHNCMATICPDPLDALAEAKRQNPEMIFVLGSFHVVKAVRGVYHDTTTGCD